jgi:hypothetical protein
MAERGGEMKKIIFWLTLVFISIPIMIPLGAVGALAELLDKFISTGMRDLENWAYRKR